MLSRLNQKIRGRHMSLGDIFVVLLLGIIIIFFVAPDQFYSGKDWVVDKISDFKKNNVPDSDISECIETINGCDYGKILYESGCKNNQECFEFFGIENLTCVNGNCLGVSNNG